MKIKEVKNLSTGLLLSALGITLVVKANLGAFPITALNLGISELTNISFGTSCMLVELAVILFNIKNKEKIGISTIANSILAGYIMDFYMLFLPQSGNIISGLLMLLLGIIVFSFGQYFITNTKHGNGAMNGLMNVLMKKTGKSVFAIRTIMEVTFMIIAYLLGGPIGLATIILSFGCGYVMNFIYKLMHFEPEKINHKFIEFDKKILSIKKNKYYTK